MRQRARRETNRQTNPNRRREPVQKLPAVKSNSFSIQNLNENKRQALQAKVASKIGLATALYDDCRNFAAMSKDQKKGQMRGNRGQHTGKGKGCSELNTKNPYAPYYRIEDVIEFGEVLSRFDNDGSGDFDKSEWAAILTIFREEGSNDTLVTDQLFLAIDKNDDGTVSVFELLRVVSIHPRCSVSFTDSS